MNANLGGVGDLLLHYNAHYKLLICLECKYAIQKPAVGSHLLRHKIYRGERQKLLSAISELELLEPDDVDVPPARCEPVEGLAVIAGHKCSANNCGSLYASVKRMRRHWSESHGLSNLPENYACAVNLQTFFRGTKLRYFEVLDREASTAEEGLLAGDGSPKQQQQQQQQDLNPMSCAQAVLFSRSSEFDLDMEKLRYFHHFTTMTSLTLPAGKPNPVKYWQTDVVAQAVHLRWLMFGLLSISASHLAVLSEDGMLKRSHLELSAQFRQEFLAGWTSADAFDDDVMKMGARMVCIQRFCVWTSEWPAQEPVPLQSFVTTIRGCTNPNIMLDSIMNSDDVTMNMNGQSTTHLPNPNASLRTDMSKSALLEHFSNLPYRMAEKLGRPNDLTDFMAVMSAIGTLIESCRQSFAADDVESVWMGVKEWPAKVSERFTQMAIIEKTPAALVVLAQWLMLVARAERFCWFLRGLAMKMLHQIVKELGEDNSLQSLVEELVGRDRRANSGSYQVPNGTKVSFFDSIFVTSPNRVRG